MMNRRVSVLRACVCNALIGAISSVTPLGSMAGQVAAPSAASANLSQFTGTVLRDDASEKPLANAEILFPALNRSVRSDTLGNFLFGDIPFGRHAIVIRLVGYESINTEITLTTAKPPGVDLMLKPITTKLANVEVKAAAPYAMRLVEFEDRRKSAAGKFLTADFFEKNDGRPVSSFLAQQIAGLKVINVNGRSWLASARGGGTGCSPPNPNCFERVPTACYMQIIVNGVPRFQQVGRDLMFNIDELNTKDIIGFEFHTTATTPLQYNGTRGTAGCGTVIIWTK